jgi:hypothetical protein
MGVVIHLDKTGTGGSGQGWNGQVEFRADLPITLGTLVKFIWLKKRLHY